MRSCLLGQAVSPACGEVNPDRRLRRSNWVDGTIEEIKGRKMGRKLATILCFFITLTYVISFSSISYAKASQGVCESPHIELTRYSWEGNQWVYVRDSDSKTFTIGDITFEITLDSEGVTVKANGEEVVYSDYREYYSDLKSKSKAHGKGKLQKFHGKTVMVRFLNIAPDLPSNGGVRWCVLQLYVESPKTSCESAKGKLKGGFPVKLPSERNRLRPSH